MSRLPPKLYSKIERFVIVHRHAILIIFLLLVFFVLPFFRKGEPLDSTLVDGITQKGR